MSEQMEEKTTNVTKATKATKATKETKEKTKKVKVDKYKGFKVNTYMQSTRCIPHIYEMMKEANPTLLEQEDVKKAFNNFVEFLIKYNDVIQSTKPTKRNKYNTGVKLNIEKDYLTELNFHRVYYHCVTELKYTFDECRNHFLTYYTPLYELIKRDVIPYMEIKDWEITSKNRLEYYHHLIENEETLIKQYERNINSARARMGEYAEKALACHNPAETTTFD